IASWRTMSPTATARSSCAATSGSSSSAGTAAAAGSASGTGRRSTRSRTRSRSRRSRSRTRASSGPEMYVAAPDDGVVVDVVFESGVLYLELANLADRPALNVSCSFEPPLVDIQVRDVAKLPLFRRVEFLGPH